MACRYSRHTNAPEVDALIPVDLTDLAAAAGRGRSQTPRHHDQRITADSSKRFLAEVIRVPMRDQDAVDQTEPCRVRRLAHSPQRTEPSAEHRIGEEAHPIEFDEDRGVADVRQPQAALHGSLSGAAGRGVRVARASRVDCGPTGHAARD